MIMLYERKISVQYSMASSCRVKYFYIECMLEHIKVCMSDLGSNTLESI